MGAGMGAGMGAADSDEAGAEAAGSGEAGAEVAGAEACFAAAFGALGAAGAYKRREKRTSAMTRGESSAAAPPSQASSVNSVRRNTSFMKQRRTRSVKISAGTADDTKAMRYGLSSERTRLFIR